MHQSKLIELFRKLSSRQLSRYEEFLQSPYFNKNQDDLLFFDYIRKYAPAFDHKYLSKEQVMQKLKLSKPVDEKSLAYLMSQQLGQLEKFLSVEIFLADDLGRSFALLEQFHNMKLPKHYKSQFSKTERALSESPFRNAGFYQQRWRFKRLQYEQSDPDNRNYNQHLQEAADALDLFFVVEKLCYANEMVNLSAMLNINYRMEFHEELMEWSKKLGFSDVAVIQVYRSVLALLQNPQDTSPFNWTKTLLQKYEKLFTGQECKQLYTLLLNYCTRRINRFNDQAFLTEYLEINKLLLANGLIFENSHLLPGRFANLVSVGLKTGQTDWTWQFIHQYKGRLPEEYAENMFHYSLAQYYYHLKELDKAQRALFQVDFGNDILLNVSSRSLLIKIYYETDQTELLLSYLEATRIFLHRNKLLDPQLKRQLQKFVEVTSKLARYDLPEMDKLQELYETLPPASALMHRDWVALQLEHRLKL